MNKRNFLIWVIFLLLFIFFGYYAFELNYLKILFEADKSYLSWVTLLLFFIAYIKLGFTLYFKGTILDQDVEFGLELSEYCLALGLLGTIVGFVFMLSGMANIELTEPETVKNMLQSITLGMSTALYTTAIGLVCSLIIRVSHYLSAQSNTNQ